MNEREQRRAEILARLQTQHSPLVKAPTASEAKLKWIRSLLDTRVMSDALRTRVREELPTMTSGRASDWIEVLKSLPRRNGRFI